MKEIEITKKVILPTEKELEAVAKCAEMIEPKQAIIVNLYLSNYESEESKAVYECMKEAEDYFLRRDIARNIVEAYCNKKNIKWDFIRILNLVEYETAFTIEALIENRVVE